MSSNFVSNCMVCLRRKFRLASGVLYARISECRIVASTTGLGRSSIDWGWEHALRYSTPSVPVAFYRTIFRVVGRPSNPKVKRPYTLKASELLPMIAVRSSGTVLLFGNNIKDCSRKNAIDAESFLRS